MREVLRHEPAPARSRPPAPPPPWPLTFVDTCLLIVCPDKSECTIFLIRLDLILAPRSRPEFEDTCLWTVCSDKSEYTITRSRLNLP